LHFMGEVDERDLHTVCKAMSNAVKREEPFRLEVAGVGGFPNVRRPKTVWGGIAAGAEELQKLHALAEPGLSAAGVYRREDRGYVPHLTLGRVKEEADGELLAAELSKHAAWMGGDVVIEEVLVMQSELRRDGPEYTLVGRATLEG
jgi:RNA 2',3'-cyclic 3'-phosphodiesterase